MTLTPEDNDRLANVCGQTDGHLRQIERRLGIEINNRGNQFRIIGEERAIRAGEEVLQGLYEAAKDEVLEPKSVHLFLQESGIDTLVDNALHAEAPETVIKTRRGMVRPAVEAGERLGFLPGDLSQKIDPYLRPLYDALYEMLGFERVAKLIERNVIEIAPLAYMRGRTLNESFIILDEAQNTTPEQMKMFLTRIGFGSTAAINGDVTQVDLPRGQTSGLHQVTDVLRQVDGISFTFFSARDVVRHPLIRRIVTAYDAFEPD
ncbi:Phosphate starvation-inducible protein PhoH, predicted ATPase [hydrothermal vent metagenome]|uniref:PhoH-like protein n=1 Tax=hydrothermal vent metagenome TaxID=652676 RepID=A0A3B1BHB6_9ZZZZ